MRLSALSLLLCALLQAGKPLVTPADAAKWETIGPAVLSNDGKWLAVSIRFSAGDGELRVHPVQGGKPFVTPLCTAPAFSTDARWAACNLGVSESEREKLL